MDHRPFWPTWEWITAPLAIAAALIGWVATVYWVLLGLQVFDFITGLAAAWKRGEPISVRLMQEGLVAKGMAWVVVWTLLMLAKIEQIPPELAVMPSATFATLFCAKEAWSVLKNAVDAGGWLPEPLLRAINGRAKNTTTVNLDPPPWPPRG